MRDLLARHADQPDEPATPKTWSLPIRTTRRIRGPLTICHPPVGETARHGNYHQPGLHDLDDLDDCWASQVEDPDPGSEEEPVDQESVDPTDREWAGHTDTASSDSDAADRDDSGNDSDGEPAPTRRVQPEAPGPDPAAFDRNSAARDHRGGCTTCGSVFDLRPYSKTELTASRTKVIVHVHVTDQTLIDQHGVLRTADGPITLDQFRRWLTDADPSISIRPVLDPAAVAAVDSYEIPLAIREAVHTRHPGSIWPFSPTTEIAVGGRLDLDHTIAYREQRPTRTDRRRQARTRRPLRAPTQNPRRLADPTTPPASTCGDHRTAGSPSSPTKAPCWSATTPTPTPWAGRPTASARSSQRLSQNRQRVWLYGALPNPNAVVGSTRKTNTPGVPRWMKPPSPTS